MNILVINSGSSSIKSKLIDSVTYELKYEQNIEEFKNHKQALELLFQKINFKDVDAFAHRVVHGGSIFKKSVLVDDEVLKQLDSIEHLAPLHNPHNTQAIKIIQNMYPNKKQIVVFDTAFHQTMPARAYMYALPYDLYEHEHIRKYGFHGSSHAFLAQQTAKILEKDLSHTNIITLHLGNGCSACAIKKGKSIDTTMGFTPLEGLMMGTRCGDIDASIVGYLHHVLGKSMKDIDALLNKKSGLKGICSKSDMREVLKMVDHGDEKARLAIDMFVYKLVKIIGAYWMVLGRVDALVFSGGIGEHSSVIRQKVVEALHHCIKVLVVPTNEELHIALEAKNKLM
ncbi:MAG: acetate/propionate family kinase [Campylobacterota bacterium]|nr:acetate/propionate family kinase [Campylobacterota bacterium]